MKKLFVSAIAAAAIAAMAIPASALEHEFGGYWRTRAYTWGNFNAYDKTEVKAWIKADGADGAKYKEIVVAEKTIDNDEASMVDTRTKLYYTAKLSDNLKLVNKFEMDAYWGDSARGDIGADGTNFEIKNSYADMTFGDWNFKLGTQGADVARGFLFADDFSGAIATYNGGDFTVPVMWVKAVEGGSGKDSNDNDVDYYIVNPTMKVSDTFQINPYLFYVNSADMAALENQKQVDVFYLGADGEMDFGMGSAWFTAIYEYGTKEKRTAADEDIDISAYLVAAGANADMGEFGVHGQFFIASGDEDEEGTFSGPTGQSYYWSEIMGFGVFDEAASNGSPEDAISNITAVNVGASMSPMPKLSVTADLWYAMLNEDVVIEDENGNKSEESDLGTELNLSASYELMENLDLTVVAAYLFAGDATGDDDPYLLGTQVSLSF